eukprot:11248349-Karenia_brevis.AAC.1
MSVQPSRHARREAVAVCAAAHRHLSLRDGWPVAAVVLHDVCDIKSRSMHVTHAFSTSLGTPEQNPNQSLSILMRHIREMHSIH